MKLIADSGSTKTEWRFIENGKIRPIRGMGINPVFLTEDQIVEELAHLFKDFSKPEEVHFYGAGVATIEGHRILESAFKRQFGANSNLFINDDLLGASRALFGMESGIACILGTGSNSCLYKNGVIVKKIPALGYILGDEGSGTDIGKRFLNALLKKDLTNALSEKISLEADFSISEVIENTYRKPQANKYLASLTRIIKKYEDESEIRAVIKEAFLSFLKKNVCKYENYINHTIGIAGSVAFHFEEILIEVLEAEGIRNFNIIEHPIEGLVTYHMNY